MRCQLLVLVFVLAQTHVFGDSTTTKVTDETTTKAETSGAATTSKSEDASPSVAGATTQAASAGATTQAASATTPGEQCDCNDTYPAEICAAAFGTDKSKCQDSNYKEAASKCTKTCGLCCSTKAYNCTDPTEGPLRCSQIKELGLCNTTDQKLMEEISVFCPRTCGKCCVDDDWYLCSYYLKDYCSDPSTQEKCPKTCGSCPGSTSETTSTTTPSDCQDLYANCQSMVQFCTVSGTQAMMSTYCRKTCKLCSGSASNTTTTGTCSDNSRSCSVWILNGFCNSSHYTDAQKRSYCSKSCGFCS